MKKQKRTAEQKPAAKPKTYTVCGKTFATKQEAKAYKEARQRKYKTPPEIKEGTRKPTHRLVSFTAKNK